MSFSGLKPRHGVAPLLITLMALSTPSYSNCYVNARLLGPQPATNNFCIKSGKVATRFDRASSSNTKNVGNIFDQLERQGDEQFSDIASRSGQAESDEALDKILKATLPSVDGAVKDAVRGVSGGTNNFINTRLTGGRTIAATNTQTGLASGDSFVNVQSWVQVFGQSLDQGFRDGVAGFEADVYGVTWGVDTDALIDDVIIGMAYTYAQVEVDSDNVNNTQSDIETIGMRVYAHYDINDTAYLMGAIGYTYGDNEYTRYNVGGVTGLNASSDYGSHQIDTNLFVANDFISQRTGFMFTPKVGVQYIHYEDENIRETGAGGASLSIDSDALNMLELAAGLDIKRPFELGNGGHVSPELGLGYRYDVHGDAVQTTSTFNAGGPSFRSGGSDPNRETLNLRLGLGYTTEHNWEFTASYIHEKRSKFKSNSGLFKAAYRF